MQRARKIALRKQKIGEFTRVEEILELDGFGVKVLERFCNSILSSSEEIKQDEYSEEEKISAMSQKKVAYVTPALTENIRKGITSCVAFHVDLNYIGWSKLTLENSEDIITRPIVLDDWVSYEIGHEDKKQSLSDLIEVLLKLNDLIPPSDVYVLESLPVQQAAKQPGNIVQMNVNVQRSQLFAMLSVLVATRNADVQKLIEPEFKEEENVFDEDSTSKQRHVYFLRNFLSSRLYKTYIGNERVSTGLTIEEIFKEDPENSKPAFRHITIPYEMRSRYRQSSNVHRDFMGQSLLNGLTFLKICVLKCPGTAEMLNNRKRKS